MDWFGNKRRKAIRDETDKRRQENRAKIEEIQAKSDQTTRMLKSIPKCPRKVAHQ